jgi:hypothetical protein
VKIPDEELSKILATFNSNTGNGGGLKDESLAQFENEIGNQQFSELIDELRQQIDQLTQRDNPVLDSLHHVVIIPTTMSS